MKNRSKYSSEVQQYVFGEYTKGRRCQDIHPEVLERWPDLEGRLSVQSITMMIGARKRFQKSRGLSGKDLLLQAPAQRTPPPITLAGPEWSRRHVCAG